MEKREVVMNAKDDKIRATNKLLLRQVNSLLYETHIESAEAASARGRAIQAVSEMETALGLPTSYLDFERKPFGQRRRESEVWNEESPDNGEIHGK